MPLDRQQSQETDRRRYSARRILRQIEQLVFPGSSAILTSFQSPLRMAPRNASTLMRISSCGDDTPSVKVCQMSLPSKGWSSLPRFSKCEHRRHHIDHRQRLIHDRRLELGRPIKDGWTRTPPSCSEPLPRAAHRSKPEVSLRVRRRRFPHALRGARSRREQGAGGAAIVAREDDERVVEHALLLERIDDPSDLRVEVVIMAA